METKDLILLMFIPILLVSLVVYVDKSPKIIGAATASEKKESNFLGTYSINPSFRAKINYDLNDYTKVKETLGNILKCVASGKEIETCISDINTNDNPFTWSLGCDKGAELVLYDFAEFFQRCIDSDDNNCLCRKDMEIKKEDIKDYLPPTNRYDFSLTEDTPLRKINIELPNFEGMSYSVNTNGLSGRIPKVYSLGYDKSDGELKFNLCFINEVLNTPVLKNPDECSETFGPTQQIMIYKSQSKDNTKVINFVNQKDNKLIYSDENAVVDKDSKPIGANTINDCNLKPKNIYKFCVTQNNHRVMAYDKLDGQIKERPVTIKFASYVPQLPPPPLTGIGVFDKLKDDKSVIIKWDKSQKADAAKYNIYYGKSSNNIFEDNKPLSDIKKKQGFNKKELDLTKINPIEANQIKLDSCAFDFSRKGCVYKAAGTEGIVLEKGRLYHSSGQDDYYFYALNIEDNVDYDFSITAIDKNGNEIDNLKHKLPLIKNKKSADDLPITSKGIVTSRILYGDGSFVFPYDFRRTHKNIDDTDAGDFDYYRVYYSKFSNLNTEQIIEKQKSIMNTPLSDLTYFFDFKFDPQKPEAFKSPKTEVKDGEYYLFIVAAFDKNSNPSLDLKPSDIGIEFPLRYPIS